MIAKTLYASGFFMGDSITDAGDYVYKQDELTRVLKAFGTLTPQLSSLTWDFKRYFDTFIGNDDRLKQNNWTRLFQTTYRSVLQQVVDNGPPHAIKNTRMTLLYPVLKTFVSVNIVPDLITKTKETKVIENKFVYIVRDPRDTIRRRKGVSSIDLDFGVSFENSNKDLAGYILDGEEQGKYDRMFFDPEKIAYGKDQKRQVLYSRAVAWKYFYDLIDATRSDERFKKQKQNSKFLQIRFEDFILEQDKWLKILEDFTESKLAKIPVSKEPIGRWKKDPGLYSFDFFDRYLEKLEYEK